MSLVKLLLLKPKRRPCGGENLRSRYEEIRQSNCNAYISCHADLCASLLLALSTNTYTSVYFCVLLHLESTYINSQTEEWIYLRTWDSNKPKRRIYVKLEIILQEEEKLLATL